MRDGVVVDYGCEKEGGYHDDGQSHDQRLCPAMHDRARLRRRIYVYSQERSSDFELVLSWKLVSNSSVMWSV
jgi:hypothetical protein